MSQAIAAVMQRHDRLRAWGNSGLDIGGVHVELRVPEDVAEDRRRAGVHDRVRRRDEVQRRHDDLVAGAAADGQEREVKRGRAVRDREGVARAAEVGELTLERLDPGPMLHHPERSVSRPASTSSSSMATSDSGTRQVLIALSARSTSSRT